MDGPPTEAMREEFNQMVAKEDIHKDETLTVDIYTIKVRLKDVKDAKWESHGMLELGHKAPMGVIHNHARYQPPALDDDSGAEADWLDISSSVRTVDDVKVEGELHYKKEVEPIESPWRFDILIQGAGRGGKFTGTYVSRDDVHHEWIGKHYSTVQVVVEVQQAPEIPKPTDLPNNATIISLLSITPFAYKNDGDVQAKSDGAQVYGDKMWQKIAMHSLDPVIREKVLDGLQPLNDRESALLKKHSAFFKRYAVHDLAERIRKMQELPQDFKRHIFYKRHWFMQAMVCFKKPETGDDPVEKYGFRRDNKSHMATLKELQASYKEVTMECYEAGYINFCPDWEKYLKHPRYWYQKLADYLVSKTHMDTWLAKLDPSRQDSKTYLPSQVDVMHWGNKLMLLKHALARTEPIAADALDVDQVTDVLNTAALNHYAYGQTIDEDLIKHIEQLINTMEEHAADMAASMDKMNNSTRQVLIDMKANLLRALTKISDPTNEFSKILQRDTSSRSPPNVGLLAAGTKQPLTFGEVLYALDQYKAERDWSKYEAKVSGMKAADIEKEFEGLHGLRSLFEEKVNFKDWVSHSAKEMRENFKDTVGRISWWGKILKGILHSAAVFLMAGELAKDGNSMNQATMVMTYMQISAIGVEWLLGKGGRWLFTKVYATFKTGRELSAKIVGWLSETVLEKDASLTKRFAASFAGNLYKVLRIVGLVCCVLGIISTNSDLDKAKTMTEDEARTFGIFNRIQFWLGVVEAAVIGLQIGFEIFGAAGAATVCGVLGVVAGALGIIVVVVYLVLFAPDPWEWLKKWLRSEGKTGGSYDESSDNDAKSEPGLELTPEKEIDTKYDLTKLPWPPAPSSTPLAPEDAVYNEFSDAFQSWCCCMVSALVQIKTAFPENSAAGKLAYRILNDDDSALTKNQLYNCIVSWARDGSSICEDLESPTMDPKAKPLEKYLRYLLTVVPVLKLVISTWPRSLFWNWFPFRGGDGKRAGGASSSGPNGGSGGSGGKPPPHGSFDMDPEDVAETKRKEQLWNEQYTAARSQLTGVLNDILDMHEHLAHPNPQQQGGQQQAALPDEVYQATRDNATGLLGLLLVPFPEGYESIRECIEQLSRGARDLRDSLSPYAPYATICDWIRVVMLKLGLLYTDAKLLSLRHH